MNICLWFKTLKQIKDDLHAIRTHMEEALPLYRVTLSIGGQTRRIEMLDTQSEPGTLEFDDALGFPTTGVPDSPPVWTSDDNGAFVTLTPSADGLSCEIAGKAPGTANITATVLIGGVSYKSNAVSVPVTAGSVASVKINLGAPTP
jgi:hypothetical protein